jgi:hypothetical protein
LIHKANLVATQLACSSDFVEQDSNPTHAWDVI